MKKLLSLVLSVVFAVGLVGTSFGQMQAPPASPSDTPTVSLEQPVASKKVKKAKKSKRSKKAKKTKKTAAPAM